MEALSDISVLKNTPYFGVSPDKYTTLSPVIGGRYDGRADVDGKTGSSFKAFVVEESPLVVECEELGGSMIPFTGDLCVRFSGLLLGLD